MELVPFTIINNEMNACDPHGLFYLKDWDRQKSIVDKRFHYCFHEDSLIHELRDVEEILVEDS